MLEKAGKIYLTLHYIYIVHTETPQAFSVFCIEKLIGEFSKYFLQLLSLESWNFYSFSLLR